MSSPTKKTCLWLAGLLAAATLASADVKVGQPFPALGGYGLEGALPDAAGKVVLVDFWASWCGPCKASFPGYAALQRELADRGFLIVAVSVDKQAGPFDEFVKRFAPPFTTVRDAGQRMVADVKVPGMPTSYLLDRHGVLREVHLGYHGDGSLREIRESVLKLLEEKP